MKKIEEVKPHPHEVITTPLEEYRQLLLNHKATKPAKTFKELAEKGIAMLEIINQQEKI